jgi:hypothetical protein
MDAVILASLSTVFDYFVWNIILDFYAYLTVGPQRELEKLRGAERRAALSALSAAAKQRQNKVTAKLQLVPYHHHYQSLFSSSTFVSLQYASIQPLLTLPALFSP